MWDWAPTILVVRLFTKRVSPYLPHSLTFWALPLPSSPLPLTVSFHQRTSIRVFRLWMKVERTYVQRKTDLLSV